MSSWVQQGPQNKRETELFAANSKCKREDDSVLWLSNMPEARHVDGSPTCLRHVDTSGLKTGKSHTV